MKTRLLDNYMIQQKLMKDQIVQNPKVKNGAKVPVLKILFFILISKKVSNHQAICAGA